MCCKILGNVSLFSKRNPGKSQSLVPLMWLSLVLWSSCKNTLIIRGLSLKTEWHLSMSEQKQRRELESQSHHFMGNRWGNSGNSVRFYFCYAFVKGLSYSWDSKESTCNTGIPGSGRSPDLHAFLRRARQRTLVFLPGESHRQRSLAGYGPWVRKESDMTEWLTVLSIVCNGPKELRFLSLNLKY